MAYVSDYHHDLFVSYAHFDNEEDSQEVRWVSRFQADLKNALRQRLGADPEFFFDTRDFQAHQHVDYLLENARHSALFLAVFSPSYTTRDFTRQELETFCERAPGADRIVTVELLPVEDDQQHHPLLRGRKRTPFWWKDKTEQDIPLRLTPKFNAEMYNERVQVLAHQIKKLLTQMRETSTQPRTAAVAAPRAPAVVSAPRAARAPAPQEGAQPKTVLLAQTTDDLYDESERVRSYLEQFGVTVLPENDYPQGGADFAAAFEADLGRTALVVQLLGTFVSRKPPDLPLTYAQFQYETAKQRGLKVLQWRRPDLDLATVTHRDKPLLEGPDVLALGLEEFKAELLRLSVEIKKAEPPRGGDLHIFINADRSDQELADALLKLFEESKGCTAARPLFEGSAKDIVEDLEANLEYCSAVLLLYGNAPPAWVRAQLLRYGKIEKRRDEPVRLKSIVLGPPGPKADIAWSGGFARIDCLDGSVIERVKGIIAGLQR
jgi:hypothetical protein